MKCSKCGSDFKAMGRKYLCKTCKRAYDESWRSRRRAAGLRASGGGHKNAEKRSAWQREYDKREENKVKDRAYQAAIRRDASRSAIFAARFAVRRAKERGDLMQQPCCICGAVPTDAHHDDYTLPLAVRWLCRKHHAQAHRRAS